jgi:hypothetical protein
MLEKLINKIPFKNTIIASALLFGLNACGDTTIVNNYFGSDSKTETNVEETYSADVQTEEDSSQLDHSSPLEDSYTGNDVSQKVDLQDSYSQDEMNDLEFIGEITFLDITDLSPELEEVIYNSKGCSDLSQYPNCFVTDGLFNGYLVVGENSAPIDNLSMTDIATSMKYVNEEGQLESVDFIDAVKLDSEIADIYAQNLIVIGNPCVNVVSAELFGFPANCVEGFTPGKAKIKLFQHSTGYTSMLVAGYSGIDTRLAAKVIANHPEDLSGQEMGVEGAFYDDVVIGYPEDTEE